MEPPVVFRRQAIRKSISAGAISEVELSAALSLSDMIAVDVLDVCVMFWIDLEGGLVVPFRLGGDNGV